jgi:signal transduction histidine kinase
MTSRTSLSAVGEVALPPGCHGARARPDERLVGELPALLRRVASQEGLERVAIAIREGLVAALGAVSASVYWVERLEGAPGGALRLAASTNTTGTGATLPIQASDPLVARAARTRTLQLGGVARSGRGAALALPLLARDVLLGVVSAELEAPLDRGDAASLDALDALDALGAVLGAIVDRARLAEEACARDEWTRVVVHELRQPLNTMALHAQWLARSPAAPVAHAGHHVRRCVKRMELLVGDLIDTTR